MPRAEGRGGKEGSSVAVRISGNEYKLKNDGGDARSLQRVAEQVDRTMERIRKRTGTVDSREVAVLTALNLARELVELRDRLEQAEPADAGRMRALIELAESTAESAREALA